MPAADHGGSSPTGASGLGSALSLSHRQSQSVIGQRSSFDDEFEAADDGFYEEVDASISATQTPIEVFHNPNHLRHLNQNQTLCFNINFFWGCDCA